MNKNWFYAKKNKYKNVKTERDGIIFDSKKEADRYSELKLLERAEIISCLQLQPKFELIPAYVNQAKQKIRAIYYVADFQYNDLDLNKIIVEDVKSEATKTKVYKIKKKLFEYKFNLTIREV